MHSLDLGRVYAMEKKPGDAYIQIEPESPTAGKNRRDEGAGLLLGSALSWKKSAIHYPLKEPGMPGIN